jgi:hypothetical protein
MTAGIQLYVCQLVTWEASELIGFKGEQFGPTDENQKRKKKLWYNLFLLYVKDTNLFNHPNLQIFFYAKVDFIFIPTHNIILNINSKNNTKLIFL